MPNVLHQGVTPILYRSVKVAENDTASTTLQELWGNTELKTGAGNALKNNVAP